MRIIQNSNLAFRCPDNLKKKLEAYAEETDVHVSAIVRAACIALLKQEAPHLFPKLSGNTQGMKSEFLVTEAVQSKF